MMCTSIGLRRAAHRGLGGERGFTLVEIMVALVIGLILTGGAIQIFVSSKQGFRANDALARVQENGRYALEFLASDIRTASFWGCAQELEMNNRLNPSGAMDFNGPELSGSEGTGPGGSDELTIRHATQDQRLEIRQAMPTVASALVVDNVGEVQTGDILIVTDCEAADVFQVTSTQDTSSSVVHNSGTGTPGNYTQSLSRRYDQSATVYSAEEKTYSLTQIDSDGDGNNDTWALQRQVNANPPEVLVNGVVDMQITYGEDTNNNEVPDYYVPADQVTDWDEVVAVRVQLLVRSREGNILDSPQDYTIAGATQTAADERMYQVFTATTGVRNRLP